MLKVVSGQTHTRVQGFPIVLAARYIRVRAHAASYGNDDYVPKGWCMTVVPTVASRERYRLAQVADHNNSCPVCGCHYMAYRDPEGPWIECACSAGYVD